MILKENFKWDTHVNLVSHKVSKNLAILNKVKYFFPQETMKILYNSLILPHFNYCIGVWRNTEKYNIDRLQILQKRAVRFITNSDYLKRTDPLFKALKILKVLRLLYRTFMQRSKEHDSCRKWNSRSVLMNKLSSGHTTCLL